MIITKENYDGMCSLIKHQNDIINAERKVIERLKEEVKQCNKLIGLYEACLSKGIQVDFPDVTGRVKGEAVEPATDNEFNFDDF